jgi:26S proteasome regulatory subunit T5
MQQADKFKTLGITPPKGCLMYGPPGMSAIMRSPYELTNRNWKDTTCSSMCSSDQCMLPQARRSGSSPGKLLYPRCLGTQADPQMYIGDGAKLVRDAFELAKQKAPAIIFIDELDAIGTKRFDSDKSGDREVQRTMLELLNQLDGFSSDSRIKVSWLSPA